MLCIGDLMLGEFVYGDVTRRAPEAPTPVIAIKRDEGWLAAPIDVARNLSRSARIIFSSAWSAKPTMPGPQGAPQAADRNSVVIDPARQAGCARRLRAGGESAWRQCRRRTLIRACASEALPSRLRQGALTFVIRRRAAKLAKPVIVDPKGHDYGMRDLDHAEPAERGRFGAVGLALGAKLGQQ